jgi:very-short-patch-repair endonuclease
MNITNSNHADAYREIVREIIDFRFAMTVDPILGTNSDFLISRWKQYIDYYEKVRESFNSTTISENQYLRQKDINAFIRRYLELFDKSVEYAMHTAHEQAIDPVLELNEEWKRFINLPENSLNENSGEEEIAKAMTLRQTKLKEHQKKYDELYKSGKDQIWKTTNTFLHYMLDRFWVMFKKCESVLEQAFFIGLFSYETFPFDWADKEKFDNQVQEGKYRLDFFYKSEFVKLDIEADGHNFHEKTEDQALNDRVRDRELQKLGFDILRFHRKEIELDLKSCVDQVQSFCEIKRQHLLRGKGQ